MDLQVQEPPEHDYRLIVVPEEKTPKIADIESINNKWTVLDVITCLKGEMIPTVLLLLATGQYIKDEVIWKAYPKSSKLLFFIVKKK